MAMEKVLVTGGAGFIGSRLVSRLCAVDVDVLVADILHPQVHGDGRPKALPESVELIPFDVTHGETWDTLLKLFRPDAVVHLAAETGTGQSLLESTRHGSVNVVGTTQMLDALARVHHVPEHIVLSSSRAVYGEGEWEANGQSFYPEPRSHADLAAGRWDPRSPSGKSGVPRPSVAGTTRTEPTSVYGATKLTQEHIVRAWGAAFDCPVSILRFQNVYGVGQSLTNPYTGILSLFAQMAVRGERLPVYEDGSIIRDFVYVEDVVDALSASLASVPDAARLRDIGSGSCTTILEVATILADRAGAPEPVVTGAFRDGDVRAASCDIVAARQDLNYMPQWKLEDGLEALVDWVRGEVESEVHRDH
jgi:dTDP-L-rhamnose 4-epimerase